MTLCFCLGINPSMNHQLSPHRQIMLPDECWELVFSFLNEPHYFDTLSLVSNHFLSITNNLVSSLTISNNTHSLAYLPRLLTRFPNLRSLDLCDFQGDLHALLLQLSQSSSLSSLRSLNVCIGDSFPSEGFLALAEKIQSLKSLTLTHIRFSPITIFDILLLLQCFPSLEELDISCYRCGPVSDCDIEALSLALPKLRKVKLRGDYLINDSMLFNLCKNCEFLEVVELSDYRYMVSPDGMARAFKVRPNLTSFMFSSNEDPTYAISSVSIASLVCLKQLTCLNLYSPLYSTVSDELLFSVAGAGLPLTKLCLQNCRGYSYKGISFLLMECRLIQHLDLSYSAIFLEDKDIKKLYKFLGNLMSIDLSGCYWLGYLSFILLTVFCPFLSKITMHGTNFGDCYNDKVLDSLNSDNIPNFQMKSLHLANIEELMDVDVEILALLCPNLEVLELRYCKHMSNGAFEVLQKCPKIKYLDLFSLTKVNLSRMKNFQFLNLEVLILSKSEIDDKALLVLSKSCPGLVDLDMMNCSQITAKGVKHVVKRCKQLRKINLTSCQGVVPSVVAWMVSSRQSLRLIYAPPKFCISESQKELFLRHGCLVEVHHL